MKQLILIITLLAACAPEVDFYTTKESCLIELKPGAKFNLKDRIPPELLLDYILLDEMYSDVNFYNLPSELWEGE